MNAAGLVADAMCKFITFVLPNWERFTAHVPSAANLTDIANRKAEWETKWRVACAFKAQIDFDVFVKCYKNMKKAALLEKCALVIRGDNY